MDAGPLTPPRPVKRAGGAPRPSGEAFPSRSARHRQRRAQGVIILRVAVNEDDLVAELRQRHLIGPFDEPDHEALQGLVERFGVLHLAVD